MAHCLDFKTAVCITAVSTLCFILHSTHNSLYYSQLFCDFQLLTVIAFVGKIQVCVFSWPQEESVCAEHPPHTCGNNRCLFAYWQLTELLHASRHSTTRKQHECRYRDKTLSLLYNSSHPHCLQKPAHQYRSNLIRLHVFTIKVDILCFVCAADASLWLDHFNHNVVCRKQLGIHVYVGWNIKIDIWNYAVSEVSRQDMAAAYGPMSVCLLKCESFFTAVLW